MILASSYNGIRSKNPVAKPPINQASLPGESGPADSESKETFSHRALEALDATVTFGIASVGGASLGYGAGQLASMILHADPSFLAGVTAGATIIGGLYGVAAWHSIRR